MTTLTDPQVQQTLTGVFRLVVPEAVLVGTACVLFVQAAVANRRGPAFLAALVGVVFAAALAYTEPPENPAVLTAASVLSDPAAAFVRWVALASAAVFLLVGWSDADGEHAAEYYGCLLVTAAGVSLVGRANDLVTLFLALEFLSIPTYVLLYLPAQGKTSQEASAKYFLLSILSSGVLLFGFSYLYGATGSTNITAITQTLVAGNAVRPSPLALLAAVMVVAAVGFRVTAVPFHFYAPDVYEGGPTGVVAVLSFLPKVAGFVALARVFGFLGDPAKLPFDVATQIPLLLWILAVVTMTVGNAMALLQDNVRRMLAYSGVAHGGYMLMGLVAASAVPDLAGRPAAGGLDAVLFYLAAYGAMTVGAFAVLLYLGTADRPVDSIDDLAGAGKSNPVAALAMAVCLFSMIGMPLTAGFAGKLMLFVGAFTAPTDTPMRHLFQILAVVAAVNAAAGAYYYLRVVGVMYLRSPLRPDAATGSQPALAAAVVLAALTVVFGAYPDPLAKAARNAVPLAAKPAPAVAAVAPPPPVVNNAPIVAP